MSISINDNILSNSPKLLDARQGPFNSVSEALTTVTSTLRQVGLLIVINIAGQTTLYWFKNGVADSDLVPFSSGGSGSIEQYINFASFPVTGQVDIIYIDLTTNNSYYWDGTQYKLSNGSVEQYSTYSNFPVTGDPNIVYIAQDTSISYYWNGSVYQPTTSTNSNVVTLTTDQTIIGAKTFNGNKFKLQGYDNANTVTLKYTEGTSSGTAVFPDASGGTVKTVAYRDWVLTQIPITSVNGFTGDVLLTTTDINEGNNRYFTEARVRATDLSGLNTVGGSISASDTILQAFGKIQSQLNTLVGSVIYKGVWNASTNTPTITSSTGTSGYYYKVSVAGTTNIDGISDWKVGDWIIFNGSAWDKIDNTDSVSSVNGFTGAVNLTTSNINEGLNLYYLDSRVQSFADTRYSQLGHTHPFSQITNLPTTLASYNINNAYTKTEINNFFSGNTAISGYNKSNWDSLYNTWHTISPSNFVSKWEDWQGSFIVTGSTIIHIVDGNEYFNSTPHSGYFAIGDISGTNGYSNIVAYQNSLNINSYYQTFNSSGSIILGDVNGNSRGTIITIDTNSNIININAASLFDTQKNSPYITDIDVQGYGFVTNSFLNTTLNNYATLNTTQTFTASKTFNYDTFFANTTSLKWGQGTTYIKGNSTGNLLEFYTNNSVSGYFDVNKNLFLNGKLSIGTTNTELLEVSAVSSSIPKISVNVTSGSHDAGSGFVIKSGGSERGGITANMSTGEVRMGAISAGSFFTTIYSNATEVIRILPNGSVGLFMTNPIAKLDILDTTLSGSGSLSGSILNLAQTWNTTGNPTAIKLNVTNTASGASSYLMDLQVGGSSKFIVDKNGNVGIGTTAPTEKLHVVGNGLFTGTLTVGAYTLPSTDGSSNQVLKTNGSGTLSWQNDNGIALTSLSATAPLSYNNTTGVFSISQANTSTNGYLSSTDWNTFNNKLNASAVSIATGQVAFGSGTNTIGGDNGLYWDNTNKRLGVGFANASAMNASAAYKLQVNGAFTFGDGTNILGRSTYTAVGGNPAFASESGKGFTFYVDNANVRAIDISSAGNVGIGTTGPGYLLDIRGTTTLSQLHFSSSNADTGGYLTSANAGNFFMSAGSAYDGSNWKAKNTYATEIGGGAGGTGVLTFYTDAALTVGNTFTPSERMRIDASGNVGIGTTTPAHKLDVNGTGRFVSDLTANSFIKSGGTSTQFLKADGTIDTNTYLTTSLAASTYQPLENQRLRTTDNVQFSSIRANDGTNGVYYFGINGKLVYTSSATTDTNLYFRYNGVNDTPLLTPINVDTYLTNYVTKDTTQTITGAKTFTNDVEVDNLNGITFNKHSVGPVYLKGDGSTVNDGGNYVLKTDVNYFGNIITEEFLSYGIASANFYSLKINYADVSTQTWVLNKNYLSGTINTWINDSISLGRFYFSGNSTTYYKGYGDGVTNPYHEFRDNNNNTKLKIHDVYSIFTDDVGAFSLFTRNPLNNSNYGPSWKFGFSTNLGCSSGMETPINILTGSESLSQVIDKVNEIISKVNSITTTLFSNNKKISVEVNNNIFELLTINDNWC